MESDRAALAWLVAAVFMGTTGLFAWQYVRARNDAASLQSAFETLQTNYDQLQQRLDAQDAASTEFLRQHSELRRDFTRTLEEIERLEAQLMTEVTRRIQRESEIPPAPE